MYAFVGHRSACEALRLLSGREPRWPHAARKLPNAESGQCLSRQREFREFAKTVDLEAVGLGKKPVDLLASSARQRSHGKSAVVHVWKHAIPAMSMYRIGDRLLVSGPELVLAQLAGYQLKLDPLIDKFVDELWREQDRLKSIGLDEQPLYDDPLIRERMRRAVRMTMLAMEFCGTYRLGVAGGKTRYKVDPLTSIDAIRDLSAGIPELFGERRLEAVLDFALERSASPMETALALMLTMPVEYGGYGFPKLQLNVEIGVSVPGIAPAGRNSVTPDILWDDEHVALEYDSSEFHEKSGHRQLEIDAVRSNVLTALGYKVFRVTTSMIESLSSIDLLAAQLAEVLGLQMPRLSPVEEIRRRELHFLLLHPE